MTAGNRPHRRVVTQSVSRMLLSGLLALAAGGVLALSACTGPSASHGMPLSPAEEARRAKELYDEAWQVIRSEYVDPSFNGQDWGQWRHHYDNKIQDWEDAYVAIGTMLASLNDEYTRFLAPRDMQEQSMSIASKLFGVGIQISVRDNRLLVMSVLEDTPASAAGLQPKDIIVAIDGHEAAGLSVEQAAERIRGPKGTQVTLTIKRGDKIFKQPLRRAEIRIKSVFTKPMDDKRIGYVRVSSFISETLMAEFNEILRQHQDKKALIIDLRGNYGGLFTNSVEMADMFLDGGDIVSVMNRDHHRRVYSAHPGAIFNDRPIVVLIDGGSASASEILSGALKDHGRATLVGTQTFGKGLVQKINTLSHGAGMNITISKYFTPKGTDINKKGIAPDIEVRFTDADIEARRDRQLERAVQLLQKKLS